MILRIGPFWGPTASHMQPQAAMSSHIVAADSTAWLLWASSRLWLFSLTGKRSLVQIQYDRFAGCAERRTDQVMERTALGLRFIRSNVPLPLINLCSDASCESRRWPEARDRLQPTPRWSAAGGGRSGSGRSRTRGPDVTMPGIDHPGHPVRTVTAGDDPAGRPKRQDGQEDYRSQRGQAEPSQHGGGQHPDRHPARTPQGAHDGSAPRRRGDRSARPVRGA
jgi:hypothetical protein